MLNNQKIVIDLVEDIVNTQIKEEQEVFFIFKDGFYEELKKNELEDVDTSDHHEFGESGDLLSYFVLAYIASIAKDLSKEGIALTKVTLNEWLKKNKKKINKKFDSDISKSILNVLEKYLSK